MDLSDTISKCADDLNSELTSQLCQLKDLWSEMFEVDNQFLETRYQLFKTYILELCGDMINSEEMRKEEMIRNVDNLKKEHEELEKELSVSIDVIPDDQPLQVLIERISQHLEQYKELKNERLTMYKCLKQQESELCSVLGMDQTPDIKEVPKPQQLTHLQDVIEQLKDLKASRQEAANSIKQSVIQTLQLLDLEPREGLEQRLVNSENQILSLSETSLQEYNDCLKALDQETKDVAQTISDMWFKLKCLWKKIGEDQSNCDDFASQHQGFGYSTIRKLEDEISRCEKLKFEMLPDIMRNVKNEIEEYWDLLKYNQSQKNELPEFFSDTLSNENLEILENELDRLINQYKGWIEQFLTEMAAKRISLMERLEALETLAADPNRLFNNRGGQLLKEEKERKTINTQLPKVNQELLKYLKDYHQRTGSVFLWHGENLMVIINQNFEEQAVKSQTKSSQKPGQKPGAAATLKRKGPQIPTNSINSNKVRAVPPPTAHFNRLNDTFTLAKGKLEKRNLVVIGTPGEKSMNSTSSSLASYSSFKGNLTSGLTPNANRRILQDVNSPAVTCSSPIFPSEMKPTPNTGAKSGNPTALFSSSQKADENLPKMNI